MRITFHSPREQRVQFLSFVYLLGTSCHILVQRGEQYNYYLRLCNNIIETIRYHQESDEVQSMRPYTKYPLKHAAEVFEEYSEYLGATDESRRILKLIKSSDEDRVNFMQIVHEKPTKKEKLVTKANSVTLEQLAEGLGVTPQRLRRALRENEYLKPGSRWVWPKSQYDFLLKKMLTFLE